MTTQVVILAAGKGTRMQSEIPKVLIPLHDKPVISHLLEELKHFDTSNTPVVVVGFQKELVKQTLGDGYLYAEQIEQRGTGDAVKCTKDLVQAENIIVLYGDMPFISASSLMELSTMHIENQSKLSMFTCTVPNFEGMYAHFRGFGRILRDTNNHIMQIKEYADAEEFEKEVTEVNPGIYMFNTQWLWEHIDAIGDNNAQHEFYLTDIIEVAIKGGEKVYSMAIPPEEVFGINTPEHLAHAHKLIEN